MQRTTPIGPSRLAARVDATHALLLNRILGQPVVVLGLVMALLDWTRSHSSEAVVPVGVAGSRRLSRAPANDQGTFSSALPDSAAKPNAIADPMRISFTYDHGSVTCHYLAASTSVRVYFCDAHSPWQRRAPCNKAQGCCSSFCPN
jgi:hypothetical protein